jgi:alginate O-acetyltransferase complex protein AlgJ
MTHDVPELDQRTTNIVLVTLFLAVISLPLAANLAGFDGADPGGENRELATFPTIGRSWSSIAGFGDGVSLWFEDHFGFRAALVRWYGESRLFLLGVSPSTAVVKGRNGWFFYGDDKSIEDYANDEPLSAEGMANWRAAVTRASDWLKGRGIAYVFTIAPDKHVVYPEEMPSSLARIRARSRTDQVYEALHGSGVASVDVRPALLDAKTHERIYQRTDTHWNDRGALLAYQQILDAVRAQVPSTPAAWTCAEFTAETRDVEALDLAGMMGLKRVLREQDLVLVPTRPRLARVVEPAGAKPTAEEGRLVTEIPGSRLPRALIFRDSFASRLVPFLSEHFSRAVYLWQNDFDANAVIKERPDVVIQEIVGRHLYSFIPSPELVPQ